MKLPIVLREQCVVVVAQVDLIGLRSQTTCSGDGKESGVDWSKRNEVGNGGEELQVQNLRLDPVDSRAQEVPTKLEVVIAEEFGGVC